MDKFKEKLKTTKGKIALALIFIGIIIGIGAYFIYASMDRVIYCDALYLRFFKTPGGTKEENLDSFLNNFLIENPKEDIGKCTLTSKKKIGEQELAGFAQYLKDYLSYEAIVNCENSSNYSIRFGLADKVGLDEYSVVLYGFQLGGCGRSESYTPSYLDYDKDKNFYEVFEKIYN